LIKSVFPKKSIEKKEKKGERKQLHGIQMMEKEKRILWIYFFVKHSRM